MNIFEIVNFVQSLNKDQLSNFKLFLSDIDSVIEDALMEINNNHDDTDLVERLAVQKNMIAQVVQFAEVK